MNTIEEIRRRIKRVIDIERKITEKERDKFEQKKQDESSYWGCGGNYRRYEKCVDAREHHLDELDILEKQSGAGLVHTETMKLYPWYCPDCKLIVYLDKDLSKYSQAFGETVSCPICDRFIYRSGIYTTWEIVTDSKHTEIHRRA